MRYFLVVLLLTFSASFTHADEIGPKDLVAQLYQAQKSRHNPLGETESLGRYFDPVLLRLYLKDKREAKGEVGRLDGDPLYNAQDMHISNFSISAAEAVGAETHVVVRFNNSGKPNRIVYVLTRSAAGWRISDIRYDDGSSLKKLLQADR